MGKGTSKTMGSVNIENLWSQPINRGSPRNDSKNYGNFKKSGLWTVSGPVFCLDRFTYLCVHSLFTFFFRRRESDQFSICLTGHENTSFIITLVNRVSIEKNQTLMFKRLNIVTYFPLELRVFYIRFPNQDFLKTFNRQWFTKVTTTVDLYTLNIGEYQKNNPCIYGSLHVYTYIVEKIHIKYKRTY